MRAINIFSTLLYCSISIVSMYAQTAFVDISKQAGIEHRFEVYEGMFGGGAAILDFNNDGWDDIYLTGGMRDDALYRNNSDGTFTNIFEQSGIAQISTYVTQGVAAADINKDGWVDIFITTITKKKKNVAIPRAENIVLINNGNSTFRDATEAFGIESLESFSTGVSFGDFNSDGYTDIYVGNYFLDYEGQLSAINDATIVNANQTARGYLLKNNEGKSLSNVFEDYKLNQSGFGFGGVFTDFDNDRDVDLVVNHDFGYKAKPNLFLENEYPRRVFLNNAKQFNMDLKINSMGTAVGDVNTDGQMDYYFTNIRFNKLMVSQGLNEPFRDEANKRGLGYVAISWGANFADFDHDGDLDLFVANGDLNPNDVPMADYYFENNLGNFKELAAAKGLNNYGIGRGSVVFDFDNDGDLDLLVVNQKPILSYPVGSETTLYRNDSTHGNWVKIKLRGIGHDRHGIGSRIRVVASNLRLMREIDGGSSHLSQSTTIAHFGLASETRIDSIIVDWIGGQTQILTKQTVNKLIEIDELKTQRPTLRYNWIIGVLLISLIVGYLVAKKL